MEHKNRPDKLNKLRRMIEFRFYTSHSIKKYIVHFVDVLHVKSHSITLNQFNQTQLKQILTFKTKVRFDLIVWSLVGFMELCAKILQIMRNDFKDYARTFCQLFLPLFAKNFFRFCITHSRIQGRPILCLWDRQNSLPPSSKTLDFLYCLARSAALTLAESWL